MHSQVIELEGIRYIALVKKLPKRCEICGGKVPQSKWKRHQYNLPGIRTMLCHGLSQAKQNAYKNVSDERIAKATEKARALGYKTDEQIQKYLGKLGLGLNPGSSSFLRKTDSITQFEDKEKKMKSAGYRGEKVPTQPKGPAVDAKLTAPPFAKKENHAPVAPVRKSIPSVAVKGKGK